MANNSIVTIRVAPYSEAERYLINELFKICKDETACRLGVIFGFEYNEYDISKKDYRRIKDYIKSKKGS